ncbi:MAG: septum formation inhibitor Maf [Calditrichaeota bacterium]|nr:MAG: septum formation inhibitor Maf [Calditrichota bacterium]
MSEHAEIFAQKLILASQSPRRAQLLSLAGFAFEIRPSFFDEESIKESSPEKHVLRLSEAKARQVAESVEQGIVIGADTIVVVDEEILGKPRDVEEAKKMLRRLAGRFHQVYTGFALVEMPSQRMASDFEVTLVHFRRLAEWEIERYVATQSPLDKAGAYGIQDQSAVFADRIEGCFYNVVGFPLSKFYSTMIDFMSKDVDVKSSTTGTRDQIGRRDQKIRTF